MMKYNDDIFRHQYPVVAGFVQHLAYYRAAKPIYDRLDMKSPFWCSTLDAHLMIAALHWCKVFGAYGPNPTHWTKTPSTDAETIEESLRAKIRTTLGFSQEQWTDYHQQMCAFRDRHVAHHEIGFANPVPDFNVALNVAYAYDEWIRDLIRPDVYSGPLLREEFQGWVATASKLAERAMCGTKGIKE